MNGGACIRPAAARQQGKLLSQALAGMLAESANGNAEPLGSPEQLVQCLQLLDDLNADQYCLLSTCLYFRVSHRGEAAEQVLAGFPREAAELTQQLLEIDRLEQAFKPDSEHASPEGLRRLLLALIKDVRVVLIALCDRLVRLRLKATAPEPERRQYARLIHTIHGPLANRLGIWQIKWELEDLVFRCLQPETYQRIAKLLDERRVDRERYIIKLVASVRDKLKKAGIEAEVRGRPKHIYSIWRKMQRKGLAFEELFDVRALRILVDDVATCYAALGLLHSLWPPVPGEFDDYVANPKGNNYQSLHTAVHGPGAQIVEMQIRTHEMDHHAELGVAAHWLYKEGGDHDVGYQRKLNWMRQLLESSGEDADDTLLDEFGGEGSDERIYALTPRGQVIDLRAGSTVLDFAYHIHTDVGHRCRGGKVNGRIVPLTQALNNGEQVEILTGKIAQPSRDWLLSRAGYLKSSRARGKVRQWFKRKDHERNLAEGREILDKELKRLAVSPSDLEPILERFHQKSVENLYVAVSSGEVTSGQVASAVQDLRRPEDEDVLPLARSSALSRGAKDDVVIDGVGNLMTSLARCCSPLPGDPIAGYITRNRGVSIHRQDCRNVLRLASADPARMLEVEWGGQTSDCYKAQLLILAYERKGLIRDIGEMLLHCHSDVLSMNTRVDEKMGRVEFDLSIRVSDFEHLGFVLNRLATIPNVYETNRIG